MKVRPSSVGGNPTRYIQPRGYFNYVASFETGRTDMFSTATNSNYSIHAFTGTDMASSLYDPAFRRTGSVFSYFKFFRPISDPYIIGRAELASSCSMDTVDPIPSNPWGFILTVFTMKATWDHTLLTWSNKPSAPGDTDKIGWSVSLPYAQDMTATINFILRGTGLVYGLLTQVSSTAAPGDNNIAGAFSHILPISVAYSSPSGSALALKIETTKPKLKQTIISKESAGTVRTFVTSTVHDLFVGDRVIISGCGSGYDVAEEALTASIIQSTPTTVSFTTAASPAITEGPIAVSGKVEFW